MIDGIILLLSGLILLSYGSDWFIVGSSRIAKYLDISNFVIGATVVAFGTSLPEIVTSIYAAYTNSPDIAIGNALGSCIANIGLVLGISVLIYPVMVKSKPIITNSYLYLIFTIIITILGYNGFSRIDGILLLLLLFYYLKHTIKNGGACEEEVDTSISTVKAVVFLVFGLASVVFGSHLFVEGARNIASYLGISEKIIGFTLVAVGTSLPELAVSISAARRKLGDIILGNVVGSNMANICGALALSSVITDLPSVKFELAINIILVTLMVLFMNKSKIKLSKLNKIHRLEGLILLAIYFIFIVKLTGIF